MPIYEYECKNCGLVTEELQKFSDPPMRKCPACGGRVKKLMSMNTFHLKGGGWYVTDYAGKKAPETKIEKDSSPSKVSEKADQPKDTSKKKED